MTKDRNADLSRRALLGTTTLMLGGAMTVLSKSTAFAKADQKSAMYQAQPKDGKKCSGCAQFKAPNACTVVDGEISPEGWCQFFVAKAG